ncbi:lysylphosphatidylglycerol synthase transmembrane domain-containing protein [Nitrosopumilus sp. S4]
MNKEKRKKIDLCLKNKAFLIVIISILFYAGIVFASDVSKISAHITFIDFRYFLLIFPLVGVNFFLRSLRYKIILDKLNIKLGIKNSFLLYLSGMSMFLTPGGVGVTIKSHILKKKIGRTYSSTTPTIIYEKWVDLISNVILLGLFFFWIDILESRIVFGIALGISIAMIVLFRSSKSVHMLNRFTKRLGPLKRFSINHQEFGESSRKLFSKSIIIKTISLTLIAKISVLGIVYFVFESMNLSLDFFYIGQIYFTSMTAGVLMLIPGGLVVVEATFLGLLTKTGMDFSVASTTVIFVRLVTLWLGIIVGFITLRLVMKKTL